MIVLEYCIDGNLRNYYLSQPETYNSKIYDLLAISRGLLTVHNSEKVHKNFHSGNILFKNYYPYISDLGICQPAANKEGSKKEGVYGVLPYVAPEVLRECQYTKASDIYSFGIIMNELISGEIPYKDIPHDHILAVEVCKGLRPKISKDIPNLFADLIMKCCDANTKNRPTAKELYQIFKKWNDEKLNENSEIYSQIKEWKKIRESNELKKSRSNKNKFKKIKTHPQAIYTSRFLNFKNLPEPVNF
jgi:serine/threonine protein kinase